MLCMLDTKICIYLIKRKPMTVVERLKSYEPGDVAIPSISVTELKYGVCKSNRPDQNRIALAEFLLPLEVVVFDESAAGHYGDIRNHLEKSGNIIGLMDLLIAAHATSLALTLITNNLREFRSVPGLRVENWI